MTLSGWTSPRIAEAFGVREDTVCLWRSDFAHGGVEALKATVAPGPAPVKSEAALRVVAPLLKAPVADRPNWTIARLMVKIEAREGIKIGRSQLSKALRKKLSLAAAPAQAERPPDCRRDRARRVAPQIAQGSGCGGRHRSALWRRKRGADPSLSGTGVGQARRGSAGCRHPARPTRWRSWVRSTTPPANSSCTPAQPNAAVISLLTSSNSIGCMARNRDG